MNFPAICKTRTMQEHYVLEFPNNIRIKSIPVDANYDDGVTSYTSRYKLDGLKLYVTRELQTNRLSMVCGNEENEQWKEFFKVLQRDLRAQIIYD